MLKIFNYKNIEVAFLDNGKGKAIVLLHGFLGNMFMWEKIQTQLSHTHRVIAIDLLGHGRTGNLGYIHSMELQAEMVFDLLKHLRLRKFTFIGHSMGGYVSLAFAEKNIKNLRGICLMNSTTTADNKDKKTNRDRAIKAVKYNAELFIKMAIPNLFAHTNQNVHENDINLLIKEAKKMSLQGIVAALEGMKIRNDRTQLFQSNAIKKLMIIGEQDPVLAAADLKLIAKKTKAKTALLNGGHMSHIENTNDLTTILTIFVKSL